MKQYYCLFAAAFLALSLQAKDVDLVKDYRARADGKGKVTEKLQKAIDDVSASGGGRVTLRGGTFLTGPVQMKDGVELHIAEGAKLLASPNLSDYKDPAMRHVDTQALPRRRSAALIWADEARDISITGAGTIDGNGKHHIRKKDNPDWKGWEYERIAPPEKTLPRVVFFTGCTHIKVEDVTMTGQPAGWSYWVHDCDSVVFHRCKIFADVRYPNNDGIHINCSRDVNISGCQIESGDDCIVLRANSRSLKENKPCERVYVWDCTLRSWSSAVRIGWDNDGVIRNCSLSGLSIWDSSNGIGCYVPRMKYIRDSNDYGREATLVENITVRDVTMEQIYGNPVYFKVADDDPEVLFKAIKGIVFQNVSARSLGDVYVRKGSDVRFDNCRFFRCSPSDFTGNPLRHGYVLNAREPADTLRAIYARYPVPVIADTPAPQGYAPVYISHFGRHGSRFHDPESIVKTPLDSLRKAQERGTITPLGLQLLSDIACLYKKSEGLWGELSAIGEQEHKDIATRMARRFAPAFTGDKKVEAYSTPSRRCIVSMASATGRIAAAAPALQLSLHTGQRFVPVIKNERFLPEAQRWYNPRLDSLLAASAPWPSILARLYTDAPEDPAQAAILLKLLWACWAEAPCVDGTGFDIGDWLSREELCAISRRMDMNLSMKCLRTDRFGTLRVDSQRHLLDDIISRADEALSSGDVAATLRYGHDSTLVPLMGLMNVQWFEGVFSLDAADQYNWNAARTIPMASNMQLVFYRNPACEKVLVKILYNEMETRIVGVQPVIGPYYDWDILKKYWK